MKQAEVIRVASPLMSAFRAPLVSIAYFGTPFTTS